MRIPPSRGGILVAATRAGINSWRAFVAMFLRFGFVYRFFIYLSDCNAPCDCFGWLVAIKRVNLYRFSPQRIVLKCKNILILHATSQKKYTEILHEIFTSKCTIKCVYFRAFSCNLIFCKNFSCT